ncbi:hypothetical protein Hdeb2414_s0010g00343581 [Helianthus debilis subsp. tardiflorus]
MTAGAEIVCNEVVCKVETMEKCGSGVNAVVVLLLLIVMSVVMVIVSVASRVAGDSCGWRWECKKAALDGNESRELLQFVSVVGVLRVTSGRDRWVGVSISRSDLTRTR